jgi:hypothetical protein
MSRYFNSHIGDLSGLDGSPETKKPIRARLYLGVVAEQNKGHQPRRLLRSYRGIIPGNDEACGHSNMFELLKIMGNGNPVTASQTIGVAL